MLQARGVRLRALKDSDLPRLVKWRTDTTQLHLWSVYRHMASEAETIEEIVDDIRRNRHITMIIERVSDEVVVGFIYSYEAQFVDGHCFITTFVDQQHRNKGYGAIAHALFLNYLFTYFNFNKVYVDVYGFNDLSLETAKTGGYVEEGRFPMHRYYDGESHELIRYAYYRFELPKLRRIVGRMSRSSTEGRE